MWAPGREIQQITLLIITFKSVKYKKANTTGNIHQSITVKSDFPSKNTDGKMPLLDVKLWVHEEQIKFGLYSKEMSSKFFIPFRSAHSQSMKRRMLANEGLRRLLNMSPDLHWNNSVKIMDEFVVKMYRSGYPSSWRTKAVKSALNMHKDMIQE